MSSMITSLSISTVATIIALIIGMPAAYGLSRYDFKGKRLLKGFFLLTTYDTCNSSWIFIIPILT